MAFNIIAQDQSAIGGGSNKTVSHTLTGTFLTGDIAILFTMPNGGGSGGSTWPSGFTQVINPSNSGNTLVYSYYVLPSNASSFSTGNFTSPYGTWLGIVRGYTIRKTVTTGLGGNETFAAGEVLLLPGGGGLGGGYTILGHGYDYSNQYSGAYCEVTTATTFNIPNVTQYSTPDTYKSYVILGVNAPPSSPTNVNATDTQWPNSVPVSWTHSDPDANPQAKYQMRWRLAD